MAHIPLVGLWLAWGWPSLFRTKRKQAAIRDRRLFEVTKCRPRCYGSGAGEPLNERR